MSDIYKENRLYPFEGKILDHFKGLYDRSYIAFLPFFKLDNYKNDSNNYRKFEKISFEQAKKELEILNKIPEPKAEIYSYRNNDFPTDKEIYENGKSISWDLVVKGAELKDISELNKALRTSIGALRQVFVRQDLTDKLDNFIANQKIWQPVQGNFDIYSKISIYRIFKLFNKNRIIFIDEFYENSTTINISYLSDIEFSEKIGNRGYYIYSEDKEILFSIEWDSFFFIIATDSIKMRTIISENLFEGFLCDRETTHNWDYLPGELDNLLKIEREQNESQAPKSNKKNWWKIWK